MTALATIAKRLGGEVTAGGVNAPGPNHSTRDRSLRIWYDAEGELAFTSYSPRDSWGDCRDYLIRLGVLDDDENQSLAPARRKPVLRAPSSDEDAARRQRAALQIFAQASEPGGTIVEAYLHGRGVALPPAGAAAIRFAPSLNHGPSGGVWPAMVALATDAATGKPVAIHRTYLRQDGCGKAPIAPAKMTLGPCKGGVVRLVDDAEVEQRLAVAEGIETALTAIRCGFPTWAALSAGNMAALPVFRGVDLAIIADNDASGTGQRAAATLARRWAAEGGGLAAIILPPNTGEDWNDRGRPAP